MHKVIFLSTSKIAYEFSFVTLENLICQKKKYWISSAASRSFIVEWYNDKRNLLKLRKCWSLAWVYKVLAWCNWNFCVMKHFHKEFYNLCFRDNLSLQRLTLWFQPRAFHTVENLSPSPNSKAWMNISQEHTCHPLQEGLQYFVKCINAFSDSDWTFWGIIIFFSFE